MLVQIKTETGSVYFLDSDKLTWERVIVTTESGPLRTITGKLLSWPSIVVGERVALFCPPYTEDSGGRLITTSRVESIFVIGDDTDARLKVISTQYEGEQKAQ